MAQDGSPTPRRALEPLPDEPGKTAVGGRFGSRAFADDEPPAPTSTRRLRRQAMSPLSPDDPLDVQATTPVPPPLPVLPDSEAGLAPAAGRRFSASAEPSEVVWAAPRRSAVSANSPASAIEAILPPVVRPKAPPAVTVAAPTLPPPPPVTATTSLSPSPSGLTRFPKSAPTAPTAPPDAPSMAAPAPLPARAEPEIKRGRTPKPPKPVKTPRPVKEGRTRAVAADPDPEGATVAARKRSTRPAMIIISAVAAVVLVVAAGVWALTLRSIAPSGGPSTTGTASALDPLLTAADLGTLGGAIWVDSTGTSDEVRPLCLPAAADGLPTEQHHVSRKLGASASATDAVLQVVDTYPDVAAATQAYAARLAQGGSCADAVALISGAATVNGLADSANIIRLTVQDTTDQFHSLLLTRTGRTVSMIDVGTSVAVAAADLANVGARVLSRQCSGGQGTCPGSITVSTTPPPPGNPLGWLVSADLPRITAGAGRWGATEPQNTLQVVGSQCEAMNLRTVTGTTSAAQRTLLLADDTNAPQGFGVDQVVYTFADATAAETLAKKLEKNLSGCPDRAPTATVTEGSPIKGTGVDRVRISGSSFLVTQKTETNTVVFRVAVLTVGERLVYLLANPSTNFDFSNADWGRIAVRAGQRASQAS